MTRYFYYPIEQPYTLPEEGNEYSAYGICVFHILGCSAIQIASVPDVSCDREFVFNLAYRCTTKQISPVHLLDVILDTLS